ncbi:carboxylate-amine ligase [Pseudomonas sp. PB105]|uniref:carboxylate-amine ligase n=1 Tax=unclassified Pseudomonas TaxID=196821 RepID=UPI000C150A76|nr:MULTISPECIES: carboxylate-amine ligase [unclassified Pseudomonas]KAE9655125.1 carboxylate-amine ligase [Pseudomonas sp. PB105]MVW95693.1 carboxylate-amine ligase [Pseudomonas sp. PB100]PIB53322.1 carboxylate--amine ligase [Pseudomonas sp. 2822-17]
MLTFGIEEEYFITDLHTRRMLAEPSAAVLAACRKAIGAGFADEMFQGQIEVASPVFHTSHEAAEYLATVRHDLARSLGEFGLGVVCAGSHPLADWREQAPTERAHFRQLFDAIQHVARRSVLCGLHVHVAVPTDVDRIAVMNQVSSWLPLLLLLSCSSPFWDGAPTGFMSYRQAVCDEWPRMGVPEHFADWAAYQRYLALLQRIGAIKADGNGWWGIRPAARYPTLELRMTDACPRMADALALATFYRVMVTHACGLPSPGVAFTAESRWLLQENRWQAKRYGAAGTFALDDHGATGTAEQWLQQAERTFAATADALGEPQLFDTLHRLLDGGNSAVEQLHCHAAAQASGAEAFACLQQVVDRLLAQSRADH